MVVLTARQFLYALPLVGLTIAQIAREANIDAQRLYSISACKSSGTKYRPLIVNTLKENHPEEYKRILAMYR